MLVNGKVTRPNGKEITDVVPVGLTVTHSCNIGFTLYGQSELTCNSSGQLNGIAPICTGMFNYILKGMRSTTHFVQVSNTCFVLFVVLLLCYVDPVWHCHHSIWKDGDGCMSFHVSFCSCVFIDILNRFLLFVKQSILICIQNALAYR